MTIIIFLIVLAVLIFVHELGHFLLAKANGIRVDAFALGFGPSIVSWEGKETKYSINIVPFGGYVKIFGENPDEESLKGPDSARSFVNKNRLAQAVVLVAGVLFNFLFAWFLYVGIFANGVTATTDGFEKYASDFTNPRIMITDVVAGSPADKAGIKLGDVVIGARDPASKTEQTSLTGAKIEGIQQVISSSNGKVIDLVLTRGDVLVKPEQGVVADKYAIGIAMQDVADLKLPFTTAFVEGLHYTWVMIRETALGLYAFIADIFHGTANFSDVSGPVGIAGIVGNAAELGFTYLLMVTALISINLGVINLLPFPALDGGRVLFVLLESIFRRRISHKFTNVVNAVGFVLLMILMVIVTYKDIAKLIK